MSSNVDELKSKYFSVNRKKQTMILFLLIILIILIILSFSVGSSTVDLKTVITAVADTFTHNNSLSITERIIVMDLRLPEVLAAVLVGMSLSNAGLLMQGIFRNPLVCPYTLGVSGGASFGAALAIVLASSFTFIAMFKNIFITLFAFGFAVLTMFLVQGIGKMAKESSKSLILAGVAIGYLFSALVSLLKYVASANDLPEIVFWMMGSLSNFTWTRILIIFISCTISMIIMMVYAWDLNVMATGEESSVSLGVNYKKVRKIAMIVSTVLTAVAVCFAGTIGFIGMVAPHLARMIVGNDYRYTIPTASLIGAILLLVSDTISRTIVYPMGLPVGIITSMLGVPFFIWLIVRKEPGV